MCLGVTGFQWARELGLRCTPPVRIPAYPTEHLYAIVPPLTSEIGTALPYVRDFDSHSYMREWEGKVSVLRVTKIPLDSCIQSSVLQ